MSRIKPTILLLDIYRLSAHLVQPQPQYLRCIVLQDPSVRACAPILIADPDFIVLYSSLRARVLLFSLQVLL